MSPALEAFFSHFNNVSQPTYVTSLCCGCSPATIPVAEISHYWNIPQVSITVLLLLLNIFSMLLTLQQIIHD